MSRTSHEGKIVKDKVVHWDEAAMLLGTTQSAKEFLQEHLNPIDKKNKGDRKQ